MSSNTPVALRRLLGQHPAALRSVRWIGAADGDAAGAGAGAKEDLEIETKQGLVTLIDHRDGTAYCRPPAPPDARGKRRARDLTEAVPVAFDQRPVIAAVVRVGTGSEGAWRFELSTGSSFAFEFPAAKVAQRLNNQG